MITIQGRLNPSKEVVDALDALMRSWSSCKRYAYKRLLEGAFRKDLKKELSSLFGINTRYSDDAILEANEVISSLKEKGKDPSSVVFGGKGLFKQLSKKHLSQKQRVSRKQEWKEKRQCNLYSRGDKSKQGNLNLRIIQGENQFFLRINNGDRKWLLVPFQCSHKKFPYLKKVLDNGGKYSVRVIKRNNRYTLFVSIEETIPQESITASRGAIGIDLNAYPSHIAWTEVDAQGNYTSSGTVTTNHLYDQKKDKRTHFAWQAAHHIVKIAKEKNKAIVLENLSFTEKKKKSPKLRRIFSNFSYKSLKEKIILTAQREGVRVSQVHPAFTSIIGSLKYAPQYNLRAETRIHQKKKEASSFQDSLNALWKVLMVVVLTGYFTEKCNLSTLKRKLIQGFGGEYGWESHGLDPALGDGLRVANVSSVKSDPACPI